MKKKLLIVLGVGSSIPSGMPSVSDLDKQMNVWSAVWAEQHKLPNYFGLLRKNVGRYCSAGDRRRRPDPNFEKILGEMIALSHWMTPAPWGDSLRETACTGKLPPHLEFPSHPFVEFAPYAATVCIEDQKNTLLGQLAKHMRAECLAMPTDNDVAEQFRALIDQLKESFDVGIYNLNYDVAAIRAFPESFKGFSEAGIFDPISVHRRTEWKFVYHLHGSVHHSFATEHGGDIRWRRDLQDAAHFFDNPITSANDSRLEACPT